MTSGFAQPPETVGPISIPHAACPSLHRVAVAAENAGAIWLYVLQPTSDWKYFVATLSAPLAELDMALATAFPQVPDQLARDLGTVRRDVQVGRVELFTATSVSDYLIESMVLPGYSTLQHAGALVGNACGFTLAPAI